MPNLTLTEKGQAAARDVTLTGPGALFMDYLQKNGPSDISEIAGGIRATVPTAKRIANQLHQRGYVGTVE